MTSPQLSASTKIWERIEAEKKTDRWIKRVSVVAWTVTLLLVAILVVTQAAAVLQFIRAASAGALPWMTVLGAVLPGIIVLGILSVLIATLATVAMLFRQRAAALSEIQARLATLEDALLAQQGR